MNVSVMGVELTPDVRSWSSRQRKVAATLSLYTAVALTLSVIAWFISSAVPDWIYWVVLGLLVVVLLFVVALMVLTPKAASAAAPAAPMAEDAVVPVAAPAEAATDPSPPAAPADDGPRAITLRCGDCGTIFDVTDTGERPLFHTCPGCGAEGQLDAPAEASAAAPVPAPMAWAPPEAPAAPPAPAPAPVPAPAAKKLRLRCGGCKEIFSIEDTGERPLKRPCPHCGRMGQIS